MKSIVFLITSIFLFSCSSGKINKTIKKFDDRVSVKDVEFPLDGIGLIKAGIGFGTGFLIHSKMVLTAAHVAEKINKDAPFVLSKGSKKYSFEINKVLIPRERARSCIDRPAMDKCFETDFAILVLSKPVPKKFTRFQLLDGWHKSCIGKKFEVINAGYGVNKSSKEIALKKSNKPCLATVSENKTNEDLSLFTNCKIYQGDSGSPLFFVDKKNAYALSIAVGALNYSSFFGNSSKKKLKETKKILLGLDKSRKNQNQLPLTNRSVIVGKKHLSFIYLVKKQILKE